MGKEIKETEIVKIDAGVQVSEKDINALARMKEIEKRKTKKMKRYKTLKGYIMTDNPEHYKGIIIE